MEIINNMHNFIKIAAENYNIITRAIIIENYEFEELSFSNIRDLLFKDDNFKRIYTPPLEEGSDVCLDHLYLQRDPPEDPIIIFKHCKFPPWIERNCSISNFRFYMCEFHTASILADSTIYFCSFDMCNFNNAIIMDSEILKCNISYCHLIKMHDVNLIGTKITDSNIEAYKCNNIVLQQIVPDIGSFIGWKKVYLRKQIPDNSVKYILGIAKLYIPANAKRVSSGRKCRCDKAKVLKIYDLETCECLNTATSIYNENFEYKVGEYVYADDFDEECNYCSKGIHFFITEREAIEY